MNRLDQTGVSFVSVIQQFTTTSSMGRLTLNILLSFAQFEREIISERTRDKMLAARRKGKYIGGRPLLGYDVDRATKTLVVNELEVERVRQIFDIYLQSEGLIGTLEAMQARGRISKSWVTKTGKQLGGGVPKPKMPSAPAKHPHITKLTALAIRIEHLLATGQLTDQAEIARVAGITRARVTQIINLTNLAPDIQQAILDLEPTTAPVPRCREHELLTIAILQNWEKPRLLWKRLDKRSASEVE